MEIGNINSSQNVQMPQNKPSYKEKFIKSIEDSLELSEKYENTPRLGSDLNILPFAKKISDEEVARINETREIPEGYMLKYSPKTIIHHYQNGLYIGDSVTPLTYNLYKNTKLENLRTRNMVSVDKLPDGVKVMNDEKGLSYLVKNDETLEGFAKKRKSVLIYNSAIIGILAGVGGLALYFAKKY